MNDMEEIRLNLNELGSGSFYIDEDHERVGEMVISIAGSVLTVYHTEVASKYEGRGLAGRLLDAMVAYARKNHLTVRALCPYVHARFSRDPQRYADVWSG